MMVELKPETGRLVEKEISSGRVRSVDELILFAIQTLREKSEAAQSIVREQQPRKHLYDLLSQPPSAGSDLDLESQKDYPRPGDL